jgi:hypothetical protein
MKMKKAYLVILAVTLLTVVVVACTKGYESHKTVGNLSVTLTADQYPLIKGDNSLHVKIADAANKAVTDAKVEARYYMPAMPGMAPMEFTTQAALKGSAYTFGANIPMEGGWKIDVSVTPPGSAVQTVTFNVDAR